MPHKTLVTRSLDAKASQLQPQIKGRWGLIVLRDFKHDADLPPRQSFFLWKKNYWTYASMSKWTWPLGGEADDTFEKGCVTHSPQSGGMSHFVILLAPAGSAGANFFWIAVEVLLLFQFQSIIRLVSSHVCIQYADMWGYMRIYLYIYKWYINIYYILYIYIKIRMCVCN